jgi:hypothetical protein
MQPRRTFDGRRAHLACALLHSLLWSWSAWAWIQGPFRGQPLVDGAEIMALAQGEETPLATKSPLYPWLLGWMLRALGPGHLAQAWGVAALGLALSLANLSVLPRLCALAGRPEATPFALLAWTLSGSVLVHALQPLEPLLAAACLAWGTWAALQARSSTVAGLGGALLCASLFARASLLPAAALMLLACVRPRPGRPAGSRLAIGAGALSVLGLCALGFGARAWPGGAAFNLRLGNGAQRSGFTDLRPGPAYSNLRVEAAFAPAAERGAPPEFERYHARALARELGADPLGGLRTLARKAYLFFFRTEIVSDSEFRHGLRRFPLAPVLLASLGLIAPLALLGLWTQRTGPAARALGLPVAGVFLANVLWVTCARYRLPALPFLCCAAGIGAAALRTRSRLWGPALALALCLNVNGSGRALLVPWDGAAQEVHLLVRRAQAERAAGHERAWAAVQSLAALESELAGGRDARAHYELAWACEQLVPGADEVNSWLERAERHYLRALELEPRYAEAAENLVALDVRRGRLASARERAAALYAAIPHAGKLWLSRSELERGALSAGQLEALRAQGFRRLALRDLAQGELASARQWAQAAEASALEGADRRDLERLGLLEARP